MLASTQSGPTTMMIRDDNATARCMRLAVGLRETDLEQVNGLDPGAVAAWEECRAPVSDATIDQLTALTVTAATLTATLIERAAETGQIDTFLDDAMTLAATDGQLAFAAIHRACAGRAAVAVPDTTVLLHDPVGTPRPGWMAALCAAHGLGMGHVRKWFDVPRRTASWWLTGVRPAPAGVVDEIHTLIASAREHVDELVTLVDVEHDPIVWVCATEQQMERRWPELDHMPLPTHQICAARAAAVSQAQLAFHVD